MGVYRYACGVVLRVVARLVPGRACVYEEEVSAVPGRKVRFPVSVTQVAAGVLASLASAAVGLTIGVPGSFVGAALGAAAYTTVAGLYTHSAESAARRVRARFSSVPTAAGVPATADFEDDVSDVVSPPRRQSHWAAVLAGGLVAVLAFSLAALVVWQFAPSQDPAAVVGPPGGVSPVVAGTTEVTRVSTVMETSVRTVLGTEVSTRLATSVVTVPSTVVVTETSRTTPSAPPRSPDPTGTSGPSSTSGEATSTSVPLSNPSVDTVSSTGSGSELPVLTSGVSSTLPPPASSTLATAPSG